MRVGDRVPDFEVTDQRGATVRLSSLLENGRVVLFFYPRALTPGCTKESCHFRDLAAEFAEVRAQRIGISADPVERQQLFDEKHDLGYPLLSDPDRVVARLFGTKRFGPLGNKRVTFVIDTDGTLLGEVKSEIDMHAHGDAALRILREADAG